MVANALQTKYDANDYQMYKAWTKDVRFKQLGFCLALFKIKNNAHVQCVFSGEFSQGKTSSGWLTAKYDKIYTKRLFETYLTGEYQGVKLKPLEHEVDLSTLRFTVRDNIIISPKDPASINLKKPKKFGTYLIDEGMLFATTSEANMRSTRNLRKSIAGNRKMNPSMYWMYPNIFKMPTALLEMMDIWVHKENVKVGDVIIPSRVIQIKEKFDKARVEKYARYPRIFPHLIKHHPSFIAKIKFARVKGPKWEAYLRKYEKYKWVDDEDLIKEDSKITFFKKLEGILSKDIASVKSAKDKQEVVYRLIYNAMIKNKKNPTSANQAAASLTDKYIQWEEEGYTSELTKTISTSMLENIDLELDTETS